MERIRVAILGQGRSGRDIHGRHLKADGRYVVAAIVDPLEDRRIRASGEYGPDCTVLSDYRDLFDLPGIDLVINATPSHLHAPITAELISHGMNVVCEKPLARKSSDVDGLITLAKGKGVVFTVFQQSRFAPSYRKVREIMDSGILGRIVQVSISYNGFARRWDWQCIQGFNGGNLLNTGPHPLDQALDILDDRGAMPQILCSMDRANTFGDAEDYVKLVMRLPGKPLIDLEISSCCAYPSFTYNVQGTRGGLKSSLTEAEWRYFTPDEAPGHQLVTGPLTDAKGFPAYCGESLQWHTDSWKITPEQEDTFAFMSRCYYDMIFDHFVNGVPLTVLPEQVRQQIAVIEECHNQNPLSLLDYDALRMISGSGDLVWG